MCEFNVKNKVVVVTGGAGGIGYAIAEEFLKKDAKIVILLDIAEKGFEFANELNSKYGSEKAVFIKCDITCDIDISERIFDEYNKIDILVNSAGIFREDTLRKTMEINAIGTMEWSLKFYEHMSENKEGTIINVASAYGILIDEFVPVYKASKFAIVGFSRTLGHSSNFEKSGVRVIILCPSFTKTEFGRKDNGIKDIESWLRYLEDSPVQEPNVVGRAAVQVFEYAKSGTAWMVFNGDITEIP